MSIDQRAYWAAAAAGIPLLALIWKMSRTKSHPPFPPGPPRDPIIGNLRNFPQTKWQETFTKLQETYGGLIYYKVLGQPILVVNSLEVAKELMDKRGNIYSGRPGDFMVYTIMGWDWNVVMAQPGKFHSECLTIFRKAIGQQEMSAHQDLIQEETRNLIPELAGVRGDPYKVLLARVGAIVICLTYGDSVYREHGQALIDLNHETLDLVTSVSTQFWLVNFIPIREYVHYLPDWLPLTFKKIGNKGLELQKKMHFWGWEQVEKHRKEGIAGPSVALQYLEANENIEVARDALGMMYAAGVDNTATTLANFIAIMLLHPEEQRKVQAELDDVFHHGVLPAFKDRDSLPILDAAWRESIRLHPSVSLGIPHCPTEDDVYKNMYIPKGTYILPNAGCMFRDPALWDEPDLYRPERWLVSHNPNAGSLPDVYDIVFGFGRRICPGLFLADQTGFTFAAAILQAYDIVPLEGESLPKGYTYQDAVISRPEGVRCQFRRRA